MIIAVSSEYGDDFRQFVCYKIEKWRNKEPRCDKNSGRREYDAGKTADRLADRLADKRAHT